MNGAFGSILTAFPEARTAVSYFNQIALAGSGWQGSGSAVIVSGILQCTGGRRVKVANGNTVIERQMRFWIDQELRVGWFINDGLFTYRLGIPDNEWDKEAGFFVYDCERVVGADGTEAVEPAFSQGGGNFA